MKMLFIGGTGLISSAVSPLVIERGHELYLFNRGQSQRPAPDGAQILHGDIRDAASARRALAGLTFDVVVDWICFTAEQAQTDIDLFSGRTGQYVFISSASAYQKPPATLPITESTPLRNPYWLYSRNKIACEDLLITAYRNSGFPATIVRPSHTYDKRSFPWNGGYTVLDRIKKGKKVVVHGDGSSLWVMTHHTDLARAFAGLLGNPHAVGEAFHITSDEIVTWNQIYEFLAAAAGAQAQLVHLASEAMAAHFAAQGLTWGDGIVGDKQHSLVFDNSKIKRFVPGWVATVPFRQGAQEIVDWHEADPARQVVDPALDAMFDQMVAAAEAALPKGQE
jgi:nucleoside-diphosphate-sugar epimerase